MLLRLHDLLDLFMYQIYSSCLCLSCLVNNIPKQFEICFFTNFYCERTWEGYSCNTPCALDEISTLLLSWYWNIFLLLYKTKNYLKCTEFNRALGGINLVSCTVRVSFVPIFFFVANNIKLWRFYKICIIMFRK